MVLAVAFALGTVALPIGLLDVGQPLGDGLAVIVGLSALAVPLAWVALRLDRLSWSAWAVVAPAFGLAVYSVVTGFHNGLTDEPYAMPAFAGPLLHGHNPYVDPVSITYNQYGTVYTIDPTYVYLPALIFLQPFVVSYRWFTVASWAVMVVLVRRRPVALVAVGQATLGLFAASGFNDFPVLLLLTLGTVGVEGHRQKWAEWLSLGCKQFANVFVIAYHAIRRDVRGVVTAVVVTVLFAVPFLLWNAGAFLCGAVILWPSSCGNGVTGGFFGHINYWAWPIWALGVFFEPLRAAVRRRLGRPAPASATDGLSSAAGTTPGEP